jgi:hypothetical protein
MAPKARSRKRSRGWSRVPTRNIERAGGGGYLCHCWRTWKLGRDMARAEVGIRFTDEQWDRLGAVVDALDNVGKVASSGLL